MSNLLPDRTTSEYMMSDEIEPTEPPPPYSEFPTETSSDINNNEQPTNEHTHDHSSTPETFSPSHFTQSPMPHPNIRSDFPFPNEYPFTSSTPHHMTPQNVHLQLPFTQFSHPNIRTPLLPTTYLPMRSPINEAHPFLPSDSRSRGPTERVYSTSHRATTRQVIESDDCCCTAPCEISTWGCLIYLTLFSLPFGLFCFTWVIISSIVCFVTLILPPLGYIVCLVTAVSYRMLGRIELITQQLCGGQPRLFHELGFQIYPPVFSLASTFSPLQSQGCFSSSLSYITDAYTRRCFIYFLMIKSFLSIITFIVTIFAVIFSIPLALCLLGPALYLVKTIGVWQKEVAFEFLA
ncbi:hypothetical protein RclHR1_04070006 [Rhizophagus clarus]|uniref:Uncharacterized protein n=1 Tax=Rhizophagus clarus TaxID=94130 RepID=A0A2Z6RGC0_9GLOM|nr:hypothetical protein RclHR1_04070006 [Rhizophagus clarus]GET02008.1 hypothetical protein RCL_jg15620.t1 [Rhizophagus clarus]